MNTIELVAVGNDIAKARSVAAAVEGTLLCDERERTPSLPFRTLVAAVTDDPGALADAAEVGAYVVCRRVVKPRAEPAEPASSTGLPGAVALFTMVHNPALTHREADRHWRDLHAPLALKHHQAMSHYTQLSVLHRLHGPDWHGFALCGFDSLEDLREHFFATPLGKIAIRTDVARFADTKKSPRRLIVREARYGAPALQEARA
jgi:hypothetical protein